MPAAPRLLVADGLAAAQRPRELGGQRLRLAVGVQEIARGRGGPAALVGGARVEIEAIATL